MAKNTYSPKSDSKILKLISNVMNFEKNIGELITQEKVPERNFRESDFIQGCSVEGQYLERKKTDINAENNFQSKFPFKTEIINIDTGELITQEMVPGRNFRKTDLIRECSVKGQCLDRKKTPDIQAENNFHRKFPVKTEMSNIDTGQTLLYEFQKKSGVSERTSLSQHNFQMLLKDKIVSDALNLEKDIEGFVEQDAPFNSDMINSGRIRSQPLKFENAVDRCVEQDNFVCIKPTGRNQMASHLLILEKHIKGFAEKVNCTSDSKINKIASDTGKLEKPNEQFQKQNNFSFHANQNRVALGAQDFEEPVKKAKFTYSKPAKRNKAVSVGNSVRSNEEFVNNEKVTSKFTKDNKIVSGDVKVVKPTKQLIEQSNFTSEEKDTVPAPVKFETFIKKCVEQVNYRSDKFTEKNKSVPNLLIEEKCGGVIQQNDSASNKLNERNKILSGSINAVQFIEKDKCSFDKLVKEDEIVLSTLSVEKPKRIVEQENFTYDKNRSRIGSSSQTLENPVEGLVKQDKISFHKNQNGVVLSAHDLDIAIEAHVKEPKITDSKHAKGNKVVSIMLNPAPNNKRFVQQDNFKSNKRGKKEMVSNAVNVKKSVSLVKLSNKEGRKTTSLKLETLIKGYLKQAKYKFAERSEISSNELNQEKSIERFLEQKTFASIKQKNEILLGAPNLEKPVEKFTEKDHCNSDKPVKRKEIILDALNLEKLKGICEQEKCTSDKMRKKVVSSSFIFEKPVERLVEQDNISSHKDQNRVVFGAQGLDKDIEGCVREVKFTYSKPLRKNKFVSVGLNPVINNEGFVQQDNTSTKFIKEHKMVSDAMNLGQPVEGLNQANFTSEKKGNRSISNPKLATSVKSCVEQSKCIFDKERNKSVEVALYQENSNGGIVEHYNSACKLSQENKILSGTLNAKNFIEKDKCCSDKLVNESKIISGALKLGKQTTGLEGVVEKDSQVIKENKIITGSLNFDKPIEGSVEVEKIIDKKRDEILSDALNLEKTIKELVELDNTAFDALNKSTSVDVGVVSIDKPCLENSFLNVKYCKKIPLKETNKLEKKIETISQSEVPTCETYYEQCSIQKKNFCNKKDGNKLEVMKVNSQTVEKAPVSGCEEGPDRSSIICEEEINQTCFVKGLSSQAGKITGIYNKSHVSLSLHTDNPSDEIPSLHHYPVQSRPLKNFDIRKPADTANSNVSTRKHPQNGNKIATNRNNKFKITKVTSQTVPIENATINGCEKNPYKSSIINKEEISQMCYKKDLSSQAIKIKGTYNKRLVNLGVPTNNPPDEIQFLQSHPVQSRPLKKFDNRKPTDSSGTSVCAKKWLQNGKKTANRICKLEIMKVTSPTVPVEKATVSECKKNLNTSSIISEEDISEMCFEKDLSSQAKKIKGTYNKRQISLTLNTDNPPEEIQFLESHPAVSRPLKKTDNRKPTDSAGTKACARKRPHKCSGCSKAFLTAYDLRIHSRIHTGELPYSCSHCGKKFRQVAHLYGHKLLHTGEKPHKCPQCGRHFTLLSTLKRHIQTHVGDRPYKCPQCDRTFSQIYVLNAHIRTHTGDRCFKCSYCPRVFAYVGQLKVHEPKHTEQRTGQLHKCNQCDKSFTQLGTLKKHLQMHAGQPKYVCSYCGRGFIYSNGLNMHIKIHTGEKCYQCPHCDKSFTQASHLKIHVRIHTGEKPYKCPQCLKSFTQIPHLRIHIRNHIGEKPYKCCHCTRCFAETTSLRKHVRTHKGLQYYKCPHCVNTFPDLVSLTSHTITHNYCHRTVLNSAKDTTDVN